MCYVTEKQPTINDMIGEFKYVSKVIIGNFIIFGMISLDYFVNVFCDLTSKNTIL